MVISNILFQLSTFRNDIWKVRTKPEMEYLHCVHVHQIGWYQHIHVLNLVCGAPTDLGNAYTA